MLVCTIWYTRRIESFCNVYVGDLFMIVLCCGGPFYDVGDLFMMWGTFLCCGGPFYDVGDLFMMWGTFL